MNAPLPPDDAVLGAWLDDELDPAARAEVDAWLQAHPDDAARVQAWAADRDALRRHFAPVAEEPVPDTLARTVWRGADAGWPWARAAVAAGLVVAGALLGGSAAWWLKPGAPLQAAVPRGGVAPTVDTPRGSAVPATARGSALPAAASADWVHRAAVAHSVYVPEQRHPVEVRAQEDHLARWLTRRTSVPVKLFDLQAQGFSLVGGRLLPDSAGPSAQLMYEDAGGRRVTVYLRKPEADTPAAFRYEQQGTLGLFYWVEGGAGYALAGSLPKAELLALAEAIYRQQPPAAAASAASR